MLCVNNLKGVTSSTRYNSGALRECIVNEENVIETPLGVLIPRYSRPDVRTKELKSLSFYENGSLHSVYLNEQTDILTPLGTFPAELLTFYEDGSLFSVFPLNGQIGFGWSEEEEGALAKSYDYSLPFGEITVKLNGMRFYPSGRLKSLLFWPGETVLVNTPLGTFPTRIGVRLFEDGLLESFEPASPIIIDTPIGPVMTYDVNAMAIEADCNSVCFDHEGELVQAKTSGDIIVKSEKTGRKRISSQTRMGLIDDTVIKLALTLSFEKGRVIISDGSDTSAFEIEEHAFLVLPDYDLSGFECAGECAGCAGCN